MEERIIYRAMQMLEQKTGIKARWYASATKKNIDGYVELKGSTKKYKFSALSKREVKTINLIQFQEIAVNEGDLMIIAETIYPVIREQLKKMNINYLDGVGNCYIRKEDWMFLIDGVKNDVLQPTKKSNAFTKTGLMLIFHFLNDEAYLNTTYRQIADDYSIAIGSVNKVLSALKTAGYLIQHTNKEIKFINKKELLMQWIEAFEEKLKPSLEIGHFRLASGNDKEWKNLTIDTMSTQWGSEPAASLLTGYLKPGKLTLYTLEEKLALIKKYRLVPDEKGNLVVYQKFWKFNTPLQDTVPAILVYADLISSGDPRNIETARKLYDGQLKDQF